MKIFGIIVLVLVALITGFLFYEGVFYSVKVTEEVIGDYWVVYEGHIGSYEQVGPVMEKIYQNLKKDGVDTTVGFGIYYDNPQKVEKSKLRSEIGAVLDEKDYGKINDLKTKYNIKEIKKRKSLVASFPIRNTLSFMVGPIKVYPAMEEYSKKNKIDLNKVKDSYGLELYDMKNKKTIYIMPVE
ncbi:MAG: GyrI-like domain-containing protein [Candidatus Omnitrophota bacterium]|nr:GyrI-like domain-containing protein [Candidatus Omnitrophota bacterium]MBU1894804.1 GyrI-like domain-containing protein [Candidatus Omnitrophota bacterium]